jgi:transcriptional/translational regulatory protein YebC/TACO1
VVAWLIVDCLTDNNNRTFNDVRQCFNKNNAKIGNPGAVAHMFDYLSIFAFKGTDEDAVLEALMDADVDVTDVENENGVITVFAPNTEFFRVKTALSEAMPGIDFDVEDIAYVPHSTTKISGEDAQQFEKLVAALDDCDDVQQVYHNAEIED